MSLKQEPEIDDQWILVSQIVSTLPYLLVKNWSFVCSKLPISAPILSNYNALAMQGLSLAVNRECALWRIPDQGFPEKFGPKLLNKRFYLWLYFYNFLMWQEIDLKEAYIWCGWSCGSCWYLHCEKKHWNSLNKALAVRVDISYWCLSLWS